MGKFELLEVAEIDGGNDMSKLKVVAVTMIDGVRHYVEEVTVKKGKEVSSEYVLTEEVKNAKSFYWSFLFFSKKVHLEGLEARFKRKFKFVKVKR